ncbi:hypothetical protein LAB17_002147 [Salmonella enterica subsp. enterica serovar Newport]|nr:hypothetical protein [Salmonella enterica subsp. enterica serovar Newport]
MSLLQRVYGHDELTMEAIKFQDGSLFKEMTEFFRSKQGLDKKDVLNVFKDGHLTEMVKRYTGLNIEFSVDVKMGQMNAYVYPPDISTNNTILADYHRLWMRGADGVALLKKIKDTPVGYVDLEKGRVYGIFEELKIRSAITYELLTATEPFLPEEKAAIMLHEIGHAFTFLETLSETVRVEASIMTVQRELLGTTDKVKRIELAKALNKTLDTNVDVNKISDSDDGSVWYTVYVSNKAMQLRNVNNAGRYTDVASEFMADQFATRHGGGEYLVSGLAKMFRLYGTNSMKSKTMFWLSFIKDATVTILIAISFTSVNILGMAIFVAAMALAVWLDPTYSIYDNDMERFRKIKQDLIIRLKDRDLPSDIRSTTLDTIKTIDETLSAMNNNRTFMQMVTLILRPGVRKAVKQEEIQQVLSSTMNSDLFKTAATLDSIIA